MHTEHSNVTRLCTSSRIIGLILIALFAWACSATEDETFPRVVSLTPLGTRAMEMLSLTDLIVAADVASRGRLAKLVPDATLEDVIRHRPDLVLIGLREPPRDAAQIEVLETSGIPILEIAPHQMEEALFLYEALATMLGKAERGRTVARRIGDPFARTSARQLGRVRPRVAVVVDDASLLLAGGHSFETDLVEMGGGESLTHGNEEARVATNVEDLRAAAPDLVIVAMAASLPDARRAELATRFAPLRVVFDVLDTDELWLGNPQATIKTWEALVDSARDPDSS